MSAHRLLCVLGVGLASGLGWGCGVDIDDAGVDQSAITSRHSDGGTNSPDAGVPSDDGGYVYPDPSYWPVQPPPGAPDSGYVSPIAPVPDAGAPAPSYPEYPEYPTQPPDAGAPLPAPISLSCSAAIWTFAAPYANFADFEAWYSLTTASDGSTTAVCIVKHKAPPRNDAVAFSSRGTVTAAANQRTPDCKPESGWVFTRYSNGVGVTYSTSNKSGSQQLNCYGGSYGY